MAIRFSLSSYPLTSPSHAPSMGPIGSPRLRVGCNKLVMKCSKNHPSVDNILTRSFHKNNVIFEDRLAGIVCYRDENGEITCEGYDEGPRFHHNLSSNGGEIIELLRRCWFQVGDGESRNKEED